MVFMPPVKLCYSPERYLKIQAAKDSSAELNLRLFIEANHLKRVFLQPVMNKNLSSIKTKCCISLSFAV